MCSWGVNDNITYDLYEVTVGLHWGTCKWWRRRWGWGWPAPSARLRSRSWYEDLHLYNDKEKKVRHLSHTHTHSSLSSIVQSYMLYKWISYRGAQTPRCSACSRLQRRSSLCSCEQHVCVCVWVSLCKKVPRFLQTFQNKMLMQLILKIKSSNGHSLLSRPALRRFVCGQSAASVRSLSAGGHFVRHDRNKTSNFRKQIRV